MPVTITTSTGQTLTPELILGYEFGSDTNNVLHKIIDGDPVVTLREAAPRDGDLEFLFVDEAAALNCEKQHKRAATFTLLDTDRPALTMRYFVKDRVEVALDDDTRAVWVVKIPFQELP